MAVMVILAAMSVVCWFIIGAKLVRLSQATNQSLRFLDQFWDSDLGYGWDAKRLEGVYSGLSRVKRAPLAMVFRAGYVELARILSDADGVGALELNISCPNIKKGGITFGCDLQGTHAVVAAVRRATELPIISSAKNSRL